MACPDELVLATVHGSAAIACRALLYTANKEGISWTAFNDSLAGMVATVCYGDTGAPMCRYTHAECLALLDTRLAEYIGEVRRQAPGFDRLSPGQKITVVGHACNVGITRYKTSRLRRMHVNGDFPAACDEYLRWKFIHGGRTDCSLRTIHCGGIYARRLAARAACRGSDGEADYGRNRSDWCGAWGRGGTQAMVVHRCVWASTHREKVDADLELLMRG